MFSPELDNAASISLGQNESTNLTNDSIFVETIEISPPGPLVHSVLKGPKYVNVDVPDQGKCTKMPARQEGDAILPESSEPTQPNVTTKSKLPFNVIVSASHGTRLR